MCLDAVVHLCNVYFSVYESDHRCKARSECFLRASYMLHLFLRGAAHALSVRSQVSDMMQAETACFKQCCHTVHAHPQVSQLSAYLQLGCILQAAEWHAVVAVILVLAFTGIMLVDCLSKPDNKQLTHQSWLILQLLRCLIKRVQLQSLRECCLCWSALLSNAVCPDYWITRLLKEEILHKLIWENTGVCVCVCASRFGWLKWLH